MSWESAWMCWSTCFGSWMLVLLWLFCYCLKRVWASSIARWRFVDIVQAHRKNLNASGMLKGLYQKYLTPYEQSLLPSPPAEDIKEAEPLTERQKLLHTAIASAAEAGDHMKLLELGCVAVTLREPEQKDEYKPANLPALDSALQAMQVRFFISTFSHISNLLEILKFLSMNLAAVVFFLCCSTLSADLIVQSKSKACLRHLLGWHCLQSAWSSVTWDLAWCLPGYCEQLRHLDYIELLSCQNCLNYEGWFSILALGLRSA